MTDVPRKQHVGEEDDTKDFGEECLQFWLIIQTERARVNWNGPDSSKTWVS